MYKEVEQTKKSVYKKQAAYYNKGECANSQEKIWRQ